MHPFSITFQTSDHLVFKILALILALFIGGTWLYHSSHIKLAFRIIGAAAGVFASYFVALLFFGILQLSYTTVKDNFDPNKQSATIINYEKYTSKTSGSRKSTRRINIFYKPILQYKGADGSVKNSYGDVSFSINNKKPVGEKIEVIVEDGQARMITPIKNFTFFVNIISLCFLVIFYYTFYNYARTQSFENVGIVAMSIFGLVIFPIAFGVITYLFLNIGYEYFFRNKRFISRNIAIALSALGIFIALCFIGYIRFFIEIVFLKKQKKKHKKKKKKDDSFDSLPES